MIVREAPGKHEDANSFPFIGPAGQLLDKIFASVGWDTNTDWYLTNIALCRPIAATGSGRENLTPKNEQCIQCYPYLQKQIELIQPKIIVAIGGSATQVLLKDKNIKISEYRGRLLTVNNLNIFPMIHPAAILHSQNNIDKWTLYRKQTWEDIQKLKQILIQLEVI